MTSSILHVHKFKSNLKLVQVNYVTTQLDSALPLFELMVSGDVTVHGKRAISVKVYSL